MEAKAIEQEEGTPLSESQKETFAFLRKSEDVAVMSGHVDGEHTAIIVRLRTEDDMVKVTPLYVAVTPDMVLTDAEGEPPK
jgi:hypothetical protein